MNQFEPTEFVAGEYAAKKLATTLHMEERVVDAMLEATADFRRAQLSHLPSAIVMLLISSNEAEEMTIQIFQMPPVPDNWEETVREFSLEVTEGKSERLSQDDAGRLIAIYAEDGVDMDQQVVGHSVAMAVWSRDELREKLQQESPLCDLLLFLRVVTTEGRRAIHSCLISAITLEKPTKTN